MESPNTVTLEYRNHTYSVPAGYTLAAALVQANLSERELLALRNGSLIDEKTLLLPGDHVDLIDTISGG